MKKTSLLANIHSSSETIAHFSFENCKRAVVQLKVLTFFTSLSYLGTREGPYFRGAEQRFIEIAKFLENCYHIVASSDDCTLLERSGVKAVYHAYRFKDGRYSLSNILQRTRKAYETLIDLNEHFDFIYVYSPLLSNIAPSVLAKRKLKIPLKVVLHVLPYTSSSYLNVWLTYRKLQYSMWEAAIGVFADKTRLWLLKRSADLIIAINADLRDTLVSCDFDSRKIVVNGNGIDFNMLDSIPEQEKIYDVSYLGAIMSYKGVFDLVKVIDRIVQQKKNFKAVIMGGGSEKEMADLRNTVRSLGLNNNIEIAGAVTDEVAFRKIKQSRLLIVPSYYETWSITICQAMALGTAVITYDLPVFGEIYPTGVVRVPIGDLKELQFRILKILNDNEFRRELEEKAKTLVRQYDWRKVATKEWKLLTD